MRKTRNVKKPTLSPTRISTYLECAMRYRYIYSDRIGRFYLRSNAQFALGSTLHNVLRSFHNEGGLLKTEDLVTTMEQKWVSAGYASSDLEHAAKAEGARMVQAYQLAHEARIARDAETIMTETQIKTDMGAFWLAGRIDRVDRHSNGSLEIVDYKTGRWQATEEEVSADLAMSIYQLILRRNYPETPVFATIYCLRSGICATSGMDEQEALRFGEEMQTLGEEIVSRDFENVEPVPRNVCDGCEFNPRCTAFWRRQDMYESICD